MASPSGVDPDAFIGHTLKLQDWLNEKSIKNIQVSICYNIQVLCQQNYS